MPTPYFPPDYVLRDDNDDPPSPADLFQSAVWDLIVGHMDGLDVGEMRSVLTDIPAEYDYHTEDDEDRSPRKLDA